MATSSFGESSESMPDRPAASAAGSSSLSSGMPLSLADLARQLEAEEAEEKAKMADGSPGAWDHDVFSAHLSDEFRLRLLDAASSEVVVRQARAKAGSVCVTGTTVWDSAVVLAQLVAKGDTEVHRRTAGCTCIELGAGTGLVGIAASRCGASKVVLTDLPDMMPLLRQNVDACAGAEAVCDVFDWGTELPCHLVDAGGPFDVVFAADCVYGDVDLDLFVAALNSSLSDGGVAFVAVEVRNEEQYQRFYDLAGKNFVVSILPPDQYDKDWTTKAVTVLQLQRRAT